MFRLSEMARRLTLMTLISIFALTCVPLLDDVSAGRKGRRVVKSPRAVRHGHVSSRLPRGYTRIWRRGEPYFYAGGVFYRRAPSGFLVVSAPIGAVVVSLPVGYRTMWVDRRGYYVYGGVFYQKVPSGYVVVDPPTTVVIEDNEPVLVQPVEAAAGEVSVIASVLNVRTGPGLRYPVIYQIQKGYILEIHGRSTGWLYVQLPNGAFGWVMNIYTDRLEPAGSG